ncbi:MAG: amino acid permease [Candidatus Ancillula sp.]|jgi:APA family basic amino acid/polyamine antiporter|nr:amino acid permease [Candidatus Ancillula sp.]
MKSIFRRPQINSLIQTAQNDRGGSKLKRTLGWWDVAVLGISMSVGAGIFSVGATVIANYAGPASILSFLIAAVVISIAAMCYAEFASTLPVTGSAYTFAYSTAGEIIAWITGWSLILELFMGASVILKFWAVYLRDFLRLLGFSLPGQLTITNTNIKIEWICLVGALIFTLLLVLGTKLSTRVAAIFVVIKVLVVLFVIVMGLKYFNILNFQPFILPAEATNQSTGSAGSSLFQTLIGQGGQTFGILGIFSGASVIAFAFLGFDNAATAAEETENPKRNMPLGLLAGIGIVSILYILMAISTAGMVKPSDYANYASTHPDSTPSISTAFEILGDNQTGAIISFGAFLGLTTVVLVAMYSLSRTFFAISRDGLLPKSLYQTSKKFSTPAKLQIGIGVCIALVASMTKVEILAEMVNIGTLFAFIIVSFSIPKLRKIISTNKDMEIIQNETFKVPLSPILPIISGLVCLWLAINLAVTTWIIFVLWLILGLFIYLFYGYSHSNLNSSTSSQITD